MEGDPSGGVPSRSSAARSADASVPRGTTILPALVQVRFDGASVPSPVGQIAAYGFVVEGGGFDREEADLAVAPGSEQATNNVAEYSGLCRALEYLRSKGFRGIVIARGDSELVIRQMNGDYEIRSERLRPYWDALQKLRTTFEDVRFEWVPREENQRADALARGVVERERRRLRG